MGCGSSKIFRKDFRQEFMIGNGGCSSHEISLTSTTYGALKLSEDDFQREEEPIREVLMEIWERSPPREEPEVIDAWELMGDLEDNLPISVQAKKTQKSEARSPLKLINQMASPKRLKRSGGKENRGSVCRWSGGVERSAFSPKRASKEFTLMGNSLKPSLNLRKTVEDSVALSQSGCFSPLFDPELVAFYEKELSEDEEQIKKMVSAVSTSNKPINSRDCLSILDSFEEKCPPGGENAAVIYTTTLRGIRKTFEDCNSVRSTVESHRVRLLERDISMDSRLKEELRGLMGRNGVKVPVLFVKGRLIGGADEVMKLEDEGKLEILLDGIPRAAAPGCDGCGGVRFVVCMDCDGSCKVLDEDGKRAVRCGQCNENGLIKCPICSCF
ncbi:uncharacterized protein At3g28850 [Diospyros lotus]|uniref:uncharacterized protein At3g28850 n=1 Tax=Diospyros lotus TaxID=55363 RepID=UPI002258267A|nr:uncharacterized protein At3g28850 [Diospyros lotus]